MKKYLINLLIATDEWVNTLFGGSPDETISFRVAIMRAEGKQFGCIFCKFLDLFQKDHCDITVFNLNKTSLLIQTKINKEKYYEGKLQ